MPDHAVQTEALRAGRPLSVGAVVVVPIEHTESHGDCVGAGAWLSVVREPYALVVRDAAGVRAIGIGNDMITLEQLRASVRGLDALLDSV